MTNRGSPTSVIPRKLDNHHATYFGAVIHQSATDLLNARSETRISDETLAGEGFNQPSTSHLSMISLFFRFETQVSWWNHSDSPRIYTWANINCRTSALCRMIFHVYIGCHRFSRSQFCPEITTLYNNSASRPGSAPQAQRFPLPWHTFLARRVQRALHARIDGVIFTRFFGAWRDSLVLGGAVGIMTTVNFISWGYNHLIN